jgi:uncharacterized membrane protein YukC
MCSNGVRWRNSKMCHPFRMVNKIIDMASVKRRISFFFQSEQYKLDKENKKKMLDDKYKFIVLWVTLDSNDFTVRYSKKKKFKSLTKNLICHALLR